MNSSGVFQKIESNRLSDEAVRQIRALIDQGTFKPGDKLPSERELIKELAVSRTSIREALRILEGLGLIEVRPGVGAYVLDRTEHDLAHVWKSLLISHKQEFIDLLEVREALETKAASLAAQMIDAEGLALLAESLGKMGESARTNDPALAVEADNEFHERLSKITQNNFLIQLNESIIGAVLESRFGYFQQPNRIELSWQQHCRVYEALQRHDADAAVAAMREHVRNSIEAIKNIV
jgi:GntR family transcriptional repressor for pyruvate dehydrogenase complex